MKDVKNNLIKNETEALNQRIQESIETQKISQKSQSVFENFKNKQYSRLFNILDEDQDGLISAKAIYIDSLDDKTIEILTGFFEDLEAEKLSLDYEGFADKMDSFSKKLTVEQKAYLFKRDPKPAKEEVKAPRISIISEKLLEKSRNSMPEDLYERLLMSKKLTEMKITKEKELKQLEEIKNCTFRPTLKNHN